MNEIKDMKDLAKSLQTNVNELGYTIPDRSGTGSMSLGHAYHVLAKIVGMNGWKALLACRRAHAASTVKIWVVTWYDRKYGDIEFIVYYMQQEEVLEAAESVDIWGGAQAKVEVDVTNGVLQSLSVTDGDQEYFFAELREFSISDIRDTEDSEYSALLSGNNEAALKALIETKISGQSSSESSDND